MRTSLTCLFILLTAALWAQKTYKVTLEPSQLSFFDRAFHIESVVDSRMNQQTIGFVQKGLANKRLDAVFSEPLELHLTKTFQRLLPAKNTVPVVANVKKLYISERTTAWKEFGKAEVSIEFMTADTLRSWGTFFAEVEQNGADVTKKHDERILQAITICLEQFADSWGRQPVEAESIELVAFDPSQPLKKGFYPSFSSFTQRKPVLNEVYEVRPNKKNPDWAIVTNKSDGKKAKDLFGFYDGKDFYLSAIQYSYQPHFVKAHYTGTYYYFEDRVSDTGAALAFGLIGALASNKTKGFVLNTKTGLVSELNRDYLAVALKDYPDLKKWYNKSGKTVADKKEVLRMLNDKLAAEG
ncbi:MAG: hypothetical protein AAF960_14885 [Bacteroidota bacterium]